MDDNQRLNRIFEAISYGVMYICWCITQLAHLSNTGHAPLALIRFIYSKRGE
jgi:hypothetical protein